MTLVTSCSLASMTPAINLLPVSLTPVIKSFHRFSVFDGVVDNGNKFIAGDINTSDKFTAGDNNKDAMGVGTAKDRRKLKGPNRRYLRPSKSYTASNGVIGIAMRSCIHRDPTHPDQRPLRLPN